MYELRAPFNELLKKGKKWRWTKKCKKAFQEIKKKKCPLSDLTLAHLDPKKKLIVASYPSDYGIGAVLLHSHPVCDT